VYWVESVSNLEWPLQSLVALEHLRKHQLEPTRGDLTNPVNGEE
jgi:hypothetical protein